MSNHYHGHVFFRQLFHNFQNFANHFRVKSGSRFVKKHHFRLHTQSTHNGNTLFLTTRKLRRICVCSIFQTNTAQQTHCQFCCFRFAFSLQLHRCNDHIFQNGHMGKEIEVLEHHTHSLTMDIDVCFDICDIHTIKINVSASRHFQQIQAAQKCGFTRTGRTDNNHNFTFFDFCIDAVQRFDGTFIIMFL